MIDDGEGDGSDGEDNGRGEGDDEWMALGWTAVDLWQWMQVAAVNAEATVMAATAEVMAMAEFLTMSNGFFQPTQLGQWCL